MIFTVTARKDIELSQGVGYIISPDEVDRYDAWASSLAFASVCYTTRPTDNNRNLVQAITETGPGEDGCMNLAVTEVTAMYDDILATVTITGTQAEFADNQIILFYYYKRGKSKRLYYSRIRLPFFLSSYTSLLDMKPHATFPDKETFMQHLHVTEIEDDQITVNFPLSKNGLQYPIVPTMVGSSWDVLIENDMK